MLLATGVTPLDIPAQIEAMATTNTISSPGAGSPNLLLYSLDNGSIQLPLNSPPNANFTGTVNGYSVDFINTSTDDGTIVNHNWDFGDGNLIDTNNTTITHTYSVNGTYIVQLTVTDDDSATGTMERNFRVKVTGKDGSGSDDKCSTGQEKRGLCSR